MQAGATYHVPMRSGSTLAQLWAWDTRTWSRRPADAARAAAAVTRCMPGGTAVPATFGGRVKAVMRATTDGSRIESKMLEQNGRTEQGNSRGQKTEAANRTEQKVCSAMDGRWRYDPHRSPCGLQPRQRNGVRFCRFSVCYRFRPTSELKALGDDYCSKHAWCRPASAHRQWWLRCEGPVFAIGLLSAWSTISGNSRCS